MLKRNTRPSTLCQLPTASPADSHSESLNCRRGGLADASEKIFFPITQRQNLLVNALRVTNINRWLLDKSDSQLLSQGLVSKDCYALDERIRHSTRSLAQCCQTHISDQSPAENVSTAIEAIRWSNKLPLVYQ